MALADGTLLTAQVWLRPGGPGAAAAARLLRRGERARAARGHRPALRRRHRAPAPPGTAARHRRRPRGARVLRDHRAPGARGVPHQRGARRLPRPRADQGVPGRRAVLRRGARAVAGRHRLHHPHAGARRHRPVPARADRAVLRRRRRRRRAAARPGARARRGDLPGRRPARVQHGRHGHAAGAAGQRRLRAARPGQQGDVRRPVAGLRHGRGADRLDHQRRARADLGRARGIATSATAADARRRPTRRGCGRSGGSCAPGW